jgi:hypothetical protein
MKFLINIKFLKYRIHNIEHQIPNDYKDLVLSKSILLLLSLLLKRKTTATIIMITINVIIDF